MKLPCKSLAITLLVTNYVVIHIIHEFSHKEMRRSSLEETADGYWLKFGMYGDLGHLFGATEAYVNFGNPRKIHGGPEM